MNTEFSRPVEIEEFEEIEKELGMSNAILVAILWLSLIFLYVFFIGEPDLQDAVIHWLMK